MNSDYFYNERRKHCTFLRKKGITSDKVLDAFMNVPRELFVSTSFKDAAYNDNALPISCGQTISQPYTVVFMTELLDLKSTDKVLEIGTGSGYQTAILTKLAAEVYSIERIYELYKTASQLLEKLNINAHLYYDDGTIGLPKYAPYDAIIVTAASPNVPLSLKKQLRIGGRMVIPVGSRESQTMQLIIRLDEDSYTTLNKGMFRFVPLVGKEGWDEKD